MKKKHVRSAMAEVAEACFHVANTRQVFEDAQHFDAYLARKAAENERHFSLSVRFRASKIKESLYQGSQVFTFPGGKHPSAVVMYLHGGAYVSQPMVFHFDFCEKLAKHGGVTVVMPLYPLAPNHTWRQAYEMLFSFYLEGRQTAKAPVVLMGDSAGGGLAIGLAQRLKQEGQPQPAKIIAFSPWLDLSMGHPDVAEYEKKDPLLAAYGLKQAGQAWAGDTPLTDPRISPAFGETAGLAPMALFVGTREIFYPDVIQFAKKLEEAGAPYSLFVGGGMNHAYPLYPIREGRQALDTVCRMLEEKNANDGIPF